MTVHSHTDSAPKRKNAWLDEIAHWLPSQLPIKDFIHHNTLHAFQHRPFECGVHEASAFFGAKVFESFAFYRQRYANGSLSDASLTATLRRHFPEPSERHLWKHRVLHEAFPEEPTPGGATVNGLRSQWFENQQLDLDSLTHPLLFRLLSNFLDQGVAMWEMPNSEKGLFRAVGDLVENSFLPLVPLSDKRLRNYWKMSEDEVIDHCLERLVLYKADHPRYVLEMLFRHPGWSGMVYQVETTPGSLLARRAITLRQAVAVELLIELGWIYRKLGGSFEPLKSTGRLDWHPQNIGVFHQTQRAKLILHEAFEQSHYQEFFRVLQANLLRGGTEVAAPKVQALFCIDDREGGIRRHLEEVWPEVETFAAAGFFGIDVMFQGVDDCYPAQQCPNLLRPKHLVRSKPVAGTAKRRRLRHFQLDHGANTLFRGWLISQVLGFWSAVRLALQVFWPAPSFATATSLSKVELDSELHLLRTSDEVTPDGLLLGFTHAEMADRVANILRQIGCTQKFAELVVITAHGASSTNNPHFAAYDCGACSGKPGAPNSRSFALMANDPTVRGLVTERGIKIPASTYFLGSMHDTTRDEVVFLDEHLVPERLQPVLAEYKCRMAEALDRNARERCRRFLQLPTDLNTKQAHREVQRRSAAIFEPRPELNHATNSLLIIGRRCWTRGMFMDRRAFMNSYDSSQDPEGKILTGIMSAAVQVCGGINLEYFFSRIDNEVYGAGTKLPHNVFGLIGVANGILGDLRTGLPSQMIEAHDPVRLMVCVEQTPQVALEAARRNPAVWEWIANKWVFYSCFDPTTKKLHTLVDGAMVPVDFPIGQSVESVDHSLELAISSSENLPMALLKRVLA